MNGHELIAPLPGHRWIVGAVVLVGAVLRLAALGDYPLAINQDELSNIYDGWSLATTGSDRFGSTMPAIVRGFGEYDWRPSLQAWLCALPAAAGGFSVAGGRLPSALLGVASLVLLYLLVRELAGRATGLLALAFAALSPWHLLYSRMAHEGAALPPFLVVLALFLWQRSARAGFPPALTALLGLVVGSGANAYQSTRLIAVLLCAAAGLHVLLAGLRGGRRWPAVLGGIGALAAGALVGAAPQLLVAVHEPARFFARARERMLPHAGLADLARQAAHGLATNLAPRYLFLSFPSYNNLSMGRALPFEAGLFYPGLVLGWLAVPRRNRRFLAVLAFALLAAVLPAALTDTEPHALRASAASLLVPAFSALGAAAFCVLWLRLLGAMLHAGRSGRLLDETPARRLLAGAWQALALLFALVAGGAIVTSYASSERMRDAGHQHLMVETAARLGELAPAYDEVLFQPFGIQPYLYVAAFGGMTPTAFQAAERSFSWGGWDECNRLGKVRFTDTVEAHREWVAAGRPRWLFVTPHGRPQGSRTVAEVVVLGQRVVFSEPGVLPGLALTDAVPLSSLPPLAADCAFAEPKMDRSFNGEPLILDGVQYAHGVGMHAPCAVSWAVPPGSTTLHALVGVAEQARACARGEVVFEVRDQDGRLLYSSGVVTAADRARDLTVALRGVTTVTLAVLEGERGRDCDHADWASAVFVR